MGKPMSFGDSEYAERAGLSLKYDAEPTASRFHLSNARVRAIIGPYGAGKSTVCVIELLIRAMNQEPYKGIRSTKFAIVRQHYPELETTALRTVNLWLPEKTITRINENKKEVVAYSWTLNKSKPMIGRLTLELPDKTVVQSEWIFIALDDDADAVKMRSLDISMGWISEASETTKFNFTTLCGRIGRFPAVKDGGCTFPGVILESNPPSVDHWIYEVFEQQKPPNYAIFHQPPGVLELPRANPSDPIQYVANLGQKEGVPCAENLKWLPRDYYMQQVPTADRNFIRVYLMGEYGQLLSGKPVYPEFRTEVHVAKEEVQPYRGIPLRLAFDYGMQPTCVIGQVTPRGQLLILDELCSGLSEKEIEKRDKNRYFLEMGIRNFCLLHLRPYLNNRYGGMELICTGDPMGVQRNQTDEQTVYQELAACGFEVIPAVTNNMIRRRESVEAFMMRIDGLLVSPRAAIVVKGFQGGYQWAQVQRPGGLVTTYEPVKNVYSHAHDCVQYLAMQAEGVGSAGGRNAGTPGSRSSAPTFERSSFNAYV